MLLLLAVLVASAVPGIEVATAPNAQSMAPPGEVGAPSGEIVVKGTGEVRVAPDQATLTLSIITRDPEAAVAAEKNAARQERVLGALRDAGIEDRLLATVGYGVQPDYARDERRNRKLVGYVAQARIRVGPLDPEHVGEHIDTALAAGANEIDSLRFSSSAIKELQRQALVEAVHDARAAAEAIADAAGGRLGALLEITTEQSRDPGIVVRRYATAEAMAAAPQTQIEAGEIVVQATVIARWKFLESDETARS